MSSLSMSCMCLQRDILLLYTAPAMIDKGGCCMAQEEQLQSSQGVLLPGVIFPCCCAACVCDALQLARAGSSFAAQSSGASCCITEANAAPVSGHFVVTQVMVGECAGL